MVKFLDSSLPFDWKWHFTNEGKKEKQRNYQTRNACPGAVARGIMGCTLGVNNCATWPIYNLTPALRFEARHKYVTPHNPRGWNGALIIIMHWYKRLIFSLSWLYSSCKFIILNDAYVVVLTVIRVSNLFHSSIQIELSKEEDWNLNLLEQSYVDRISHVSLDQSRWHQVTYVTSSDAVS